MITVQKIKQLLASAKKNTKGLTLIEFSIVLALTITLIGLVLSSTGIFNLVDKYYLKIRTQHAMTNFSAADTVTLDNAVGGDWAVNGILGTIDNATTDEMFTSTQADVLCGLLKGAGQVTAGKRGVALTFGQVANGEMVMGNANGTAVDALCITN